jgi:biofilm PGA synthesis lipoprotein PgaB
MPVLSVSLPDKQKSDRLLVKQKKNGKIAPAKGTYKRVSPFHRESMNIMTALYRDLAAHVRFHGILFQDDAYLNDYEDFNPAAIAAYKKYTGRKNYDLNSMTEKQKDKWTELKTRQLNLFTRRLMNEVRKYRPQAKSARNLYAPVLEKTYSEEWFAQNYQLSLKEYDYVVIMAYPEMENIWMKQNWLENLVKKAAEHPEGLDKTIFKLQTFDWDRNKWISDSTLTERLRHMITKGARHVAYYPDDYTVNKPDISEIRKEMSVEANLFAKPASKEKGY